MEPDVVIETDTCTVWIECKRNSQFGVDQLRCYREVARRRANDSVLLVAISNHATKSACLPSYADKSARRAWHEDWVWLPWRKFHTWFLEASQDVDGPLEFTLQTVLDYLEVFGMDNFQGFNEERLWHYMSALDKNQAMARSIESFGRELTNFFDTHSIPIHLHKKRIRPLNIRLNGDGPMVPSYFYLTYLKDDWPQEGFSHCLFVSLDLNSRPELFVGASLSPDHVSHYSGIDRKELYNELKPIAEASKANLFSSDQSTSRYFPSITHHELSSHASHVGVIKTMKDFAQLSADRLIREVANDLQAVSNQVDHLFGRPD